LITVERADFVSVPVQDMERAKRFYSETLGIHSPNLDKGWPEFETGSVSLYLVDPTQFGDEFKPHGAHIALRVPDVPEARTKLEEAGIEFQGETLDTGVCHMAFFADSEGNALMLHRRYAPPE
jgi:predicted enzyme related to lactoylglutathione lyase